MPNVDVNTYFFTGVVPVCNEGIVEHDGIKSSPVHVVREVLETLPTALQSRPTEAIGLNSPFSRNLRTHFARLVVLDQPNFNGRAHSNALVNAIMNTNLLQGQPVDQITCPYILVMLDFDLLEPDGAGDPRSYFEELWGQMEAELKSIFQYCYGFDKVSDAAGFASYMTGCQVETTMPFHDYWWEPPKLTAISTTTLIAIPAAGLLLPLIAAIIGWIGWAWAIALAVLLLILGLLVDYRMIMRKGARPFPAAPGTTLPHVLKSLYLQQAFSRFAIEQQHRDPAEWGQAFRTFLEQTRPADVEFPTQPAGVIRSHAPGEAA
ncbi:hypothetical protein [Novosphingobium beihaiensis]|uniref:Uncharacterized protein n=1 Tax=Novosphingobium beihaiensis TaxID=2930389 RepID=A0ABT0BNE2_9SPHN|nr:hypothetical protein [Novosphingobium beihaiensis]MCJ2186480.1 hypothetical protein [Novosphingobium beihaiensis]